MIGGGVTVGSQRSNVQSRFGYALWLEAALNGAAHGYTTVWPCT